MQTRLTLIAVVLCSVGLMAATDRPAPHSLQQAQQAGQQTQTPPPATKPADTPATVAGKWNGTLAMDGGPIQVTLDVKLDGKKVSGTISGDQGTYPIDGDFTGDKLTFSLSFDPGSGPLTVTFTCTLKDDALTGTTEISQMGSYAFSAQRAKDR